VADAVSSNNAVLAWIKANDGWSVIDGGHQISESLQYAENGNSGWYSGADPLSVGAVEMLTAAGFDWKQLAVPIVTTGLEMDIQNNGSNRVYDLVAERMKNAERTAANDVSESMFSDGTLHGGKELDGLKAMCSATPTTGTYGDINRATASNAFWRNKYTDTGAVPTVSTIQGLMNTMWYSLVRGSDKPDLIVVDNDVMGALEASMQALQRFTSGGTAKLGFDTLKFKSADVVMDGNCTDATAYFLNTNFMRMRVAEKRNFKPLKARSPYNQDIEVVILAAGLNLTCSNAILQGRLEFTV
jgi:hypothetical protein